jgi:hypothetical protein
MCGCVAGVSRVSAGAGSEGGDTCADANADVGTCARVGVGDGGGGRCGCGCFTGIIHFGEDA